MTLLLPQFERDWLPAQVAVRRAPRLFLVVVATLTLTAIVAAAYVEISLTVDAVGTVTPAFVGIGRASEAGLVSSILVSNGQLVEKGEALLLLEESSIRSESERLAIDLSQQLAELRGLEATRPYLLRSQADRAAALARDVTIARASVVERMLEHMPNQNVDSALGRYVRGNSLAVDVAIANLIAAQRQQSAAEASLTQAQLDSSDYWRLRYSIAKSKWQLRELSVAKGRLAIYSPISGTVLTDRLDRLLGTQVRPGDALIEVGRLTDWQVELILPERDAHNVQRGQRVLVELPAVSALDGRQLRGNVASIGLQALSSREVSDAMITAGSGSSTFRVLVDLDSTEAAVLRQHRLRRGFVVRARIVTQSGTVLRVVMNTIQERLRSLRTQ